MTTTPAEEYDQLDAVRFGPDGAAELDRHKRVIFVPRDQIVRLDAVYGSGAERPIVFIVLGLVFAGTAIVLLSTFILAVMRGGVRIPAAMITGFVLLIPAWWLLDLALRKRWFVRVRTRDGSRKLVFHDVADPREIQQFLEKGRRRYGCS
jgi:hypothetical protein